MCTSKYQNKQKFSWDWTFKRSVAAQDNISYYLNKEQSLLCPSPRLLTPLPLPLPLLQSCVSSYVHSPCDLFHWDYITLDCTEMISIRSTAHTSPVFLTAETSKHPPLSWVWGVQVQSKWGQSCHLRFPGSEFKSLAFRIWIFLFS